MSTIEIEKLFLTLAERSILKDALYQVARHAEREAGRALDKKNPDAHQHYIARATHARHLGRKLGLGELD